METNTDGVTDCLVDLLSVVIVSSPCSSHPDTTLIEKSIRSLHKFNGLEKCPIIIVLDGFVIRETPRPKKGQITDAMRQQYEDYHHRLLSHYGSCSHIRIVRSENHLGFAMAVKFGLSFCTTTYCMIAQHDRIFVRPFNRLLDLIHLMEKNKHMRYIGFPTVANRTHDSVLNSRYRISYLDTPELKLDLGENLFLQPLIFWFDSQHLCHVERYLQIFMPFATLPDEIVDWLGKKTINKMLLRKGDFIEDRFGQMQRNCLTTKGKSDDFMRDVFRWFGSYLAWIPDDKAKSSRDGRGASVMVGHLRGRQLNPVKIEIYRADVSYRLQRLHECSIGYVKNPDGIEDYQKLFENGNENEDEDEDDCDSESENETQIVNENDCDYDTDNQIVNASNSDYESRIIVEDENEILTKKDFHENLKVDLSGMQTRKCSSVLFDQIDATKILSHPSMDLSASFSIEVVSNLKA